MNFLSRPKGQYRCRSTTRHRSRVAHRSPTKHATRSCSFLGISSLQAPQDLEALVEGALLNLNSAASFSAPKVASQQQQQGLTAAADPTPAQRQVQALHSVLEFIQACHPDSGWQAAAHAALQQLSSTLVYSAAAAAAAAAKAPTATAATNHHQQQQQQSHSTNAVGQLQPLIQHAAQLDSWVAELTNLQSATAAAAAAISLDPACAPVLLLDAAAAQQHPIWASDYAAFVAGAAASYPMATPPAAGPQSSPSPAAAARSSAGTSAVLPVLLPVQSELVVGGGASLDIGHHYSTAAAASGTGTVSGNHTNSSSSSSSSSGTTYPGPMHWPLTAAATKLLLSSPLGVLPDGILHQVYRLGLVGRCGALADAVDLARLVVTELQAAQEEQQQLGHQLTQQLQQLHMAVQAGTAVDPVLLAATASAAATTVCNPPSAAATAAAAAADQGCVVKDAVVHPAVAVRFLQDLVAFGKGAAADELQSWLDLCRQDPLIRSYLEASGGLAQLPIDARHLQPHQLDALRETVAVAQANRGVAGAKSLGAQVGMEEQGGGQDWLHDYTDMNTLLPGICSMLGDCLQLNLHCTDAEPGTVWCQEAYLITVTEQQQQSRGRGTSPFSSNSNSGSGSGCSSQSQQQAKGYIWLLFDDSYHGMPATHMVSPGVPTPHRDTHKVPADHVGGDHHHRQQQQQQQQAHQSASHLLGALHATTVAIVLPSSFCSMNRGFKCTSSSSSSNGSTSSTNGSSAFSVLQSVLHELGHALHFLLSASASAAAAATGGHLSSLVLMETASHLVERMARNAACLQAMSRHRVTQQPPHPALIQQLLTYNSISTRGVYQWHQHVLAALTDSSMAAQSAAVQSASTAGDVPDTGSTSSNSCWDVLQQVSRRYNPLAAHHNRQSSSRLQSHLNSDQNSECEVVSSAMLEYLPALAVLQPGDMYCYICADLVAAALWGKYLQIDPLDPAAWQILRQGLFESDARVGTVAVVEGLLGHDSMQERSVQLGHRPHAGGSDGGGAGSTSVRGWVPNLEHSCFQDIDLWG